MKKIFLILMFMGSGALFAQQFEHSFQVALSDSVSNHKLEWIDLDNDGLLDVLVVAETSSGRQFLLSYKNDTIQGPIWKSGVSTTLSNASYLVADLDLDNDIDVLVSGVSSSGASTKVLLNEGNFSFSTQDILPRASTVMKMADLDEDGKKELILSGSESGNPFFSIYKNVNNQWQLAHDSIDVNATSVEVFDFDIDGRNDLFIAGRRADDSIITSVFYNRGNLFLSPINLSTLVDGETSVGDLNHDGYFDIVLAGKNSLNQQTTLKLLNQRHNFQIVQGLMALNDQKVFAADFNSDGLCDIQTSGSDGSGDSINVIILNDGTPQALPGLNYYEQAFGDFDRDGDLDLLQSEKVDTTLILHVYKSNDTTVNKGPENAFNVIAVKIFDRAFLYWDEPGDDHTDTESITFDVTLQSQNEDLIVGEFDLIRNDRLTVSHGNNGPNNYLLLKNVDGSEFSYKIQSIDNAFYTQREGICQGGGNFLPCEAMVSVQDVPACKNELVQLPGTPETLWFSFKDGFIDIASSMEFEAENSDTIFSVTPGLTGCAAIKIYTLRLLETLVKKSYQTKFACEGVPLSFGVEDGWQVSWSSTLKGFISNNDSIDFTPLQNDTVKVTLSNGTGCVLERNTALIISKPVVTLNGEVFKILRGAEVQLMASGGEKYKWTPPTSLSSDTTASPLAFPANTIEYTVTVTDSVGCEASGKVLVIVEGTAFIPNLFTPNGDGKNDEVKIYGLSGAESFSFTIHNREGSLVYETRDISEATTMGWNGTIRGNRQPNGVYFWRVKGKQAGRQLLLNGETSGSIVLIR